MQHYILVGKEPQMVSIVEWGAWFQTEDRHVAKTDLPEHDAEVSTVFLGIDHLFGSEGPPLLFESMIFGGEYDQEMERYSTWDEAEAGHYRLVNMVKGVNEHRA